jgi:hypothetical protein
VTPDGFVIISGTNIENISNIDIKPILQDDSLLYPHETIFTPRGDNAYCLLVFPNDLERGNYCFNVTYGTFSKDFSISFSDKQEDIVLYNSHKSFETIYFYTKNETINELVNSAQSLPRDLVESLYFSDKFVDPTTFGYKTEYLYNTYISCDDGSLVYSALGNRYYNETDVETSVYAINGGKVISVGNNLYLGNFVVIEHGLGISMLSELILYGRQDGIKKLLITPEASRSLAAAVKPDKVLNIPLKRLIAITKDFVKEYTEKA